MSIAAEMLVTGPTMCDLRKEVARQQSYWLRKAALAVGDAYVARCRYLANDYCSLLVALHRSDAVVVVPLSPAEVAAHGRGQ